MLKSTMHKDASSGLGNQETTPRSMQTGHNCA